MTGISDDKLICSTRPLARAERRRMFRFFHVYASAKVYSISDAVAPGDNACDGWCEAEQAMAHTRLRTAMWHRSGFLRELMGCRQDLPGGLLLSTTHKTP
jgi:hypothetical protein